MLKLHHGLAAGGLVLLACWLVMIPIGALAADRCGEASWYGHEHHGRRTASGAIFDQWALTAAMPNRSEMGRSYRVRFRGRSVVVLITDLGPHKRLGRIIDLSRGAAQKLGLEHAGVGRVCLERVS